MPENPPAPDMGIYSERGSSRTGVDISGYSIRDPLRELQGDKAARIFREMRFNDAIIGALVMATKMIMRSVEWTPSPREESEEAERYSKFVEECQQDMSLSWADFISDSLEAVIYGWEYMEIVYKQRLGLFPFEDAPSHFQPSKFDDGLIGWRKIAHRDQIGLVEWVQDEAGGTLGLWHRAVDLDEKVFLPIEKGVLFRTEHAGGHPEGYSWLRNAYRSYRFKKNLEWIEAVSAERAGAGLPVVRMPLGANSTPGSTDLQKAYDLVSQIRQDAYAGVVLPPPLGKEEYQAWHFELMSASAATEGNLNDTINRHSSEMTVSILAHFINLAMSSTGAYALSRDERDMWHLAMSGLADMWADTITRFMVEPLMTLNIGSFPDIELWPRIEPSDIAQHDIEKVQAFLTSMLGANAMMVSEDDRDRIREMVGFPPESEEMKQKFEEKEAQAEEERNLQMEAMASANQVAKEDKTNAGKPTAAKTVKTSEPIHLSEKPVNEWDSEDWLTWMDID